MSYKTLIDELKEEAFYKVFEEGTSINGQSLFDSVMDRSIVNEDEAEEFTVEQSALGKEYGFVAREYDEDDTLDIVRGTLNNTLEELAAIAELGQKHK